MSRRRPKDPFALSEASIPVPPSLEGYDIDDAVAELIRRCSHLEGIIEEERRSEAASLRDLLLDMLEVADALERLSSHHLEADARVNGIAATGRLLAARLRVLGVAKMPLLGKTVNPEIADVVGTEFRAGFPEDIVVREVTTCYIWNATVLRRAAVVVSSSSEE